jgi:hypothetical protein
MSDIIRVQCSKCGGVMKEKARKIRGGYSMPCTHCATAIVFENESNDSSVRQALSHARRLRRQALAGNSGNSRLPLLF